MRHSCESSRTVVGQETSRPGRGQSSLKIEIEGCPPYSASRMQKARAHSNGEAEYYAAASATTERMSIREVLFSMVLEV